MRYDGPERFQEPIKEADLLRLVAEFRRVINELELGTAPRWTRRQGIVRGPATLAFGELAVVDSAGGNIALVLPVPDKAKAGQSVRIHRRSSSNTITLTPSGGVNLDGVTTPATVPASVGGFEFVWDGEEWASNA